MNRLLIMTVVAGCAAVWTANAQEAEADKALSPESAQQRAAIIKKYDTNGDGVLSKAEQKALTKADKQALAKTGGVGTAKKAPKAQQEKTEKSKQPKPEQAAPSGKAEKPAASDKGDKGESGKK
jgi:predicted small secreted protein